VRTIPANWQAAADAASAAEAHDARILVRLQVSSTDWIWLTFADATLDATGVGAWEDEGAFSAANDYGPFPFLLRVPDLTGFSDLETLSSLSASIAGLVVSNERSDDLFAALGAYRLSELRNIAGYAFKNRTLEIHANYVGVAWADRLSWSLQVRGLQVYDEVQMRLGISDVVGAGNVYINAKMTSTDYPGLPAKNANSPKPWCVGAGSGMAVPIRDHLVFTDREGRAQSGGYVSPVKPAAGAPWTATDRVTFGSGSATVASVTGTDDTDTVLNLDAPGLARDSNHGEGDLYTDEQGYHVVDTPTSAAMRYLFADEDFTYSLGTVVHRPPETEEVKPLPPYCGTPTDNADGTFTLDKMPRASGLITPVFVDGSAGSGVAASTVFTELASAKLGLTGSQYTVEAGAGTEEMQGLAEGWTTAVQALRTIEMSSRSRIFWDGSQLKMRRRPTAAEAVSAGADWSVDRDDALEGFPAIEDLQAQYQARGFIGRYRLRPGGNPDRSDGYEKQIDLGEGTSGRDPSTFWLPFVRDATDGDAVLSFWYELLGPRTDGDWPRMIMGLALDWSFMGMEPEDIVSVVRVDGEGSAFDGLGAGNSVLWRVVSKHVLWPQEGRVGRVMVDLLEVHS
jgi:hypothetical protein